MANFRLRVMRDGDVPAVNALNEIAVPAVNSVGEDGIHALRAIADIQLVATDTQGTILAFLISLTEGVAYDSSNYAWFEAQRARHQYIDRVVVAPAGKGTGIGRALYTAVTQRALERGASEVTCEVNVMPRNERSLLFHEHLGFQALGEQDSEGGAKRVRFLALPVS